MIRRAVAADVGALAQLARETRMFGDDDLERFVAEMRGHLAGGGDADGAALLAADGAEGLAGAAFCAEEPMADRVANLVFLGVRPAARGRGVGRALVAAFEARARAAGARLAVIETASDPMFAPARALYGALGYAPEARLSDFFADGLDKIVFLKRL